MFLKTANRENLLKLISDVLTLADSIDLRKDGSEAGTARGAKGTEGPWNRGHKSQSGVMSNTMKTYHVL